MSLPNTDLLTTGIPLVIPTHSQQPTARMVLRNNRGQVVQQWLVKQNKCTLGSASSCALRCDLPGISPYHALLVLGARQVFIRALAPKLTRDGRPFNEILLTDDESHFEIAGHRFELSRNGETVNAANRAEQTKPERLKFTLARPFELSGRKAVAATVVTESQLPTDPKSLNSANFDSKWVAQLIQSAIEPLECQLHNLIQPLTELQTESRKARRLRKKRQSAKRSQPQNTTSDVSAAPTIDPYVSQQVEDLVVKHSASMDLLTERISDVNQQLTTIERIIAQEREASKAEDVPAADPQLIRQSLAIEQLQAGIGAVSTAMKNLQVQQSQERGHDLQWRSNVHEKLAGLTQVVDSLSTTVSEVHTLALRACTPEQLAEQELDRTNERQWQSDVKQQLAGLTQVVNSLSVTVADVHRVALAGPTPEQQQERGQEQQWKSNIQEQLAGLTQVIGSLPTTMTQIHAATLNDVPLQSAAQEPVVNQQWQSEVREQLSGLTQVIDSLSATVAEIYSATLSEKSNQSAVQEPAVDQQWQSDVREQLAGLTQFMASLSATIAEIHTTTLNDVPHQSVTVEPAADQQWQWEVREQLASLTQVIDSLSANVAEVHKIALSESTEVTGQLIGTNGRTDDGSWTLGSDASAMLTPIQADEFGGMASERPVSIAEPDMPCALDSDPWIQVEESCSLAANPWRDEEDALPAVRALVEESPQMDSEIPEADAAVSLEPALELDHTSEPELELVSELESELTWPEAIQTPTADVMNWEMPEQAQASPAHADQFSESTVQALRTSDDDQDVALPAWWRDDEPETESELPIEQAIVGHSFLQSEQTQIVETNFVEPDAISEVIDAADEPVEAVAEEVEEFFGLAQFTSEQVLALEEPPAEIAQVDLPKEPLVVDDVQDEELIGFGAGELSHRDLHTAVQTSTDLAEPTGLETVDRCEVNEVVATTDQAPASPTAPHALTEEDDSVEDYMRKLLARMRGVPEEQIERPKPTVPAPAIVKPESADLTTLAAAATEPAATSAPRTTVYSPETEVDSLDVTEPFDPEKYMPRALAPERNNSLAAMRELANSSARTAINKSTRKRHVSSIMLKGVVAVVGLTVGMVLVAINGLNVNIGLVATVASFLVAAIWGYDMVSSIRPMLQAGLVLRPEAVHKSTQADDEAAEK